MKLTAALVAILTGTANGCGFHLNAKRASPSNGGNIPYSIERLTDTTHLVVHNDEYIEYPFIYVKRYPKIPLTVVVDTGVGGEYHANGTSSIELKAFIEKELGFTEAEKSEYMVLSSHVHFDHIGGMEPFAQSGAEIVSSSYNKSFVAPQNRAANALTTAFGVKTPQYTISKYADQHERLSYKGVDLGLIALHTPGHTPDSQAYYDEGERWIYTGDTLYKRVVKLPWDTQDVPIILPLQGNWTEFVASIEELYAFVKEKDRGFSKDKRVKIGAGHTTAGVEAADTIKNALKFIQNVEKGKVPVIAKVPGDEVAPGGTLGDAEFWYWQADGNPEFSLLAPESFRSEFNHK
ncbi:uncharacterized protein LTR77_005348 [Saxophila tyrrhenica]|uniref:Metallo-beta-lactamase domain-containing protein n=1 Tax=Saxophila tyrrhenica TaxID=1690608 RepID=A0AAV9P888_9PEZI|nr:hypothetical protein LTR77_005348 [Saxophila tyrrhenica]